MRSSSTLLRSASTVALLAYLLVASLVPFADARLEAASGDVGSHVEQLGGNGCAPLHDHVACQLCRVLRGPSGEDIRAEGARPLQETGSVAPAAALVNDQTRRTSSPPARAPPRA